MTKLLEHSSFESFVRYLCELFQLRTVSLVFVFAGFHDSSHGSLFTASQSPGQNCPIAKIFVSRILSPELDLASLRTVYCCKFAVYINFVVDFN